MEKQITKLAKNAKNIHCILFLLLYIEKIKTIKCFVFLINGHFIYF